MTNADKITLHQKQGRAFETTSKVTLCCSGIQGGKSTVGALWALKSSFSWTHDDCAIIGAPTHKILNQSTLPTWMKYAARFGTLMKADSEFHFHDGFKVYIRTSTDPDSIEGIRNVRWVWLDEAGKCKYQFWINAEGRAARTNAPLFLTTTPYGMNWPYKHLIKPHKEGKRPDVSYHEWLSVDNPSFPLAEYERQKQILDPRTFRRKYMGMHERMEGLVYELTDDNWCDPVLLPPGTKTFAAVDWGFTEGHEFALNVRSITLDGFRYGIDEFKASGLDPNQQIAVCKAKSSTWNIETFYCDPARPDMIALMNKAGLTAIPFHLGKENYKQLIPSINEHVALIRSGRYKLFKGRVPHTEDEYETYHWPEYTEDSPAKEAPVKIKDHNMDCERMLTVGTMHIKIKEERGHTLSRSLPHRDHWSPLKRSRTSKSWDAS